MDGETMGGKDKDEGTKPGKSEGREARLAQALRANLLKRKAQGRARKAPPPAKEGGQR